jgi:hypothetical protein
MVGVLVSEGRISVLLNDCLQFWLCHHAASVVTHKTDPSLEVQILLFHEWLSGNGENPSGLTRKTRKLVNRIMHLPPPPAEPIEAIYEPKARINLGGHTNAWSRTDNAE